MGGCHGQLLDLIWPIGTVRPLVPLERLGDVYERGMTPPTRGINLNKYCTVVTEPHASKYVLHDCAPC